MGSENVCYQRKSLLVNVIIQVEVCCVGEACDKTSGFLSSSSPHSFSKVSEKLYVFSVSDDKKKRTL
jgi:hypothetical protein